MSLQPHQFIGRIANYVSERRVPGLKGAPDVCTLLYQPKRAAQLTAGLLWIHGSGYVSGSAATEDTHARQMAAELGCVLVSVDYRLAPETPYPGPLEDCYAALRWLYAKAGELGPPSCAPVVLGDVLIIHRRACALKMHVSLPHGNAH